MFLCTTKYLNVKDKNKALSADVKSLIDKYNTLVKEYNKLAIERNRFHHFCRLTWYLYNKRKKKHDNATVKCKELANEIKQLNQEKHKLKAHIWKLYYGGE